MKWLEPSIHIDKIKPIDWSFPCKKTPSELENPNVKPPNYRDREGVSISKSKLWVTMFKNIKIA